MLRSYGLILCLLMLYSCQTTKSAASDKQSQLQQEFARTLAFEVRSNWASPKTTSGMNALNNSGLIAPGNSVGRFDISRNSNYMTLDSTKVAVFLPFYGERQMRVDRNNDDNSISYTGDVKNLTVKYNEKKKRYDISFTMTKTIETFDVTIELFENLSTRTSINSTHRTGIVYDGYAKELSAPAPIEKN